MAEDPMANQGTSTNDDKSMGVDEEQNRSQNKGDQQDGEGIEPRNWDEKERQEGPAWVG